MSVPELLAELPAKLAGHDLIPATCQAIYVVGSLTRGWGNQSSDLDLVVVSSEPWESGTRQHGRIGREPDIVQLLTVEMEDRSCGIEFWQEVLVDKLLSAVSWQEFEKGQARERQLMIYEINFLERLQYALPVYGADRLVAWQQRLRASAFKAMRVKYWLHEAAGYREDALGQLAADDLYSAVLSARLAFDAAVDALLASHGELGQNAKWRARRLLTARPAALPFGTYWEIETMQNFDAAEPQKWVRSVTRTADGLSLAAQDWLGHISEKS